MGGDRVNVFARVRPLGSARAESDSEAVRLDGDTNITASAQRKTFEFDGVFGGESEQAEVFKEVGLPVVDAVLAGYHGCVFAYGQTGSGKTYSLLHGGSAAHSFQDSGLLPRLAATLYVKAARDVSHDYTVEAGCFQVYNEQVSDLLHPEHRSGKGANLSVSKDRSGHGQVDQLTWVACGSANDLLAQFASARKNVVYAETKMNKASSRSHACFQLRVGVAGKELKEAININGSLLALGNVVAALAAKKKHVPYRDSKLTRVLEGSVGGNCKTTLLCCCSPSADSTSETLAALAFAARAMRCECKAVVNEADVGDMPDCGARVGRADPKHARRGSARGVEAAAKEARAEKLKFERAAADSKAKGSRAEEARKEAAAEAERLAAKEKQIDDIMRELREAKETLATRAAVSEDEVNAEQARRDDIAARLEAEVSRERDKAAGLEEALAGASAKLEVSERARERSACESALERAAIAASQRVALEAREAAERKRLARAAAQDAARAVAADGAKVALELADGAKTAASGPTPARPSSRAGRRGRAAPGETAQLAEDLRKEASDGAARVELAERLRAQQADRHAAAEKRLAWAFSAARRCQEQKERQVLGELDVLASRFNARESRGDDLEKISRLKGSVLAERERAARLDRARTLTQLELDNERASDKIFGIVWGVRP
ncbi:hypothetical protein JL720_2239 [Aureococcus anophagefferens]|nr:hypothetical protein JL720_2239 [Aureococcus anophagefferens]